MTRKGDYFVKCGLWCSRRTQCLNEFIGVPALRVFSELVVSTHFSSGAVECCGAPHLVNQPALIGCASDDAVTGERGVLHVYSGAFQVVLAGHAGG